MPTLETTVNGLKLPNPFVIGSGPPGTNANVICKAFDEGWGAVICKTISLDASKVTNVQPRYARLRSRETGEIYGWENIELISDRSFDTWIDEFKQDQRQAPAGRADRLDHGGTQQKRLAGDRRPVRGGGRRRVRAEHVVPPRPARAEDGRGDGRESRHPRTGVRLGDGRSPNGPVWAKMTPNVTRIEDPTRASLRAGCNGISAINTIRSVLGIDLETLRPEPQVEGYTTPGGYSCQAVKPVALCMCMEIATVIRKRVPRPHTERHWRHRNRWRRCGVHLTRLATPCRSAPA